MDAIILKFNNVYMQLFLNMATSVPWNRYPSHEWEWGSVLLVQNYIPNLNLRAEALTISQLSSTHQPPPPPLPFPLSFFPNENNYTFNTMEIC